MRLDYSMNYRHGVGALRGLPCSHLEGHCSLLEPGAGMQQTLDPQRMLGVTETQPSLRRSSRPYVQHVVPIQASQLIAPRYGRGHRLSYITRQCIALCKILLDTL